MSDNFVFQFGKIIFCELGQSILKLVNINKFIKDFLSSNFADDCDLNK